jgi:serine/threonine protein kinase
LINQVNLIDGRFAPINSLGQGGFGRVYLVQDTLKGRVAALKFLTGDSQDAFVRFQREARLLEAARANPHVVQVLYYNMAHTPPYIVTEYCEGGSLRSWVGSGNPWQNIAGVLTHVVVGLAPLHAVGGFHRDLKPDNLLVTRDPQNPNWLRIKLADFGLARVPERHASPMTHGYGGTPGYIAPEVQRGSPFQPSADIYSVGVVAAELLTGEQSDRLLDAVSIPEQLRKLVRAMLSPVPTLRPTAQVIAAILNALLRASSNPEPPANGAPQQQAATVPQDSGIGGKLLFGGLVAGGILLALAALAGGEGEGGGGGGKPKVGP